MRTTCTIKVMNPPPTESPTPNIQSQYLRARYYSVADMDVITDFEYWLDNKERGWKLFESQENHKENTD